MSPALLCRAAAVACWPAALRAARLTRAPAARRLPDPAVLVGGRGGLVVPALLTGMAGLVLSTPVVAVLAAVGGGAGGRALRQRARATAAERRSRALIEALGALA